MSTYTYKLKGARWLRMWTAADRSSVYAAQSEAQKIADTLCDVPWTRAKSDGPAMFPLTAAKSLDENPANRDLFDAALFCAEHSDGAHRAYANAAMYLFKLPSTSGVSLKSVTVHVESDAYNALGARIAVHLLSSAELPTACATVRTGAAHAEGVAARRTVERDGRNYWYSNWDDKTITGGTSESPAAIGELTQYLAVFVGLENYATSRNEWLEGASYIRNLIEIETDGQISNWTNESMHDCVEADPTVLLSGGSSPTWLQPLPTVNAGATAPTVPVSAEQVDTFFTPAVVASTPTAATITLVGGVGHFTFTAKVSLYGNSQSAVGGTIECVVTDDNGVETVETGELGRKTVNGVTYIGFVSSSATYVVPSSPGGGLIQRYHLHFYITVPTFSELDAASGTWTVTFDTMKYFEALAYGMYPEYTNESYGVTSYHDGGTINKAIRLFDASLLYWMLVMTGGVPTLMDACNSQNGAGRHNLIPVIEGSASSWSVSVGGHSFSVAVNGRTVTLSEPSSLQSWDFTLSDSIAGEDYFDPSVRLFLPGEDANDAVADYGMASVVGDFSHAVATFEAGTQPSDAEVLGRLARMSRREAGAMLYLHPENGALANELDVLRPVPRFWRTATDPSGQTTSCQPGLSVWYKRATESSGGTTVTGSSAPATGIVQRERPTAETVVAGAAFLQLTVLALRAQSAFSTRLVLVNKVGASNANAVTNNFKLRFVAWRSPADQWDGSNAFAMAAMASLPSIYRSDGDGNVAWNVDCTGNLLRFGTRAMTAERIGVSQIVSGEIAAGASIGIPLAAPVAAGDVVLIAPEVLGFANGTGGLSQYFGRPSDPATAMDAGKGWARFAHNLGWFPKVTGE